VQRCNRVGRRTFRAVQATTPQLTFPPAAGTGKLKNRRVETLESHRSDSESDRFDAVFSLSTSFPARKEQLTYKSAHFPLLLCSQLPFVFMPRVSEVCGTGRPYTMLGFGDLVIPGVFVSYLRAYDQERRRYGPLC
jgi:hypothetical protein